MRDLIFPDIVEERYGHVDEHSILLDDEIVNLLTTFIYDMLKRRTDEWRPNNPLTNTNHIPCVSPEEKLKMSVCLVLGQTVRAKNDVIGVF